MTLPGPRGRQKHRERGKGTPTAKSTSPVDTNHRGLPATRFANSASVTQISGRVRSVLVQRSTGVVSCAYRALSHAWPLPFHTESLAHRRKRNDLPCLDAESHTRGILGLHSYHLPHRIETTNRTVRGETPHTWVKQPTSGLLSSTRTIVSNHRPLSRASCHGSGGDV